MLPLLREKLWITQHGHGREKAQCSDAPEAEIQQPYSEVEEKAYHRDADGKLAQAAMPCHHDDKDPEKRQRKIAFHLERIGSRACVVTIFVCNGLTQCPLALRHFK